MLCLEGVKKRKRYSVFCQCDFFPYLKLGMWRGHVLEKLAASELVTKSPAFCYETYVCFSTFFLLSSGIWYFAIWWKSTDVSEELSASIIRIGFERGEHAPLKLLPVKSFMTCTLNKY
jgi:hypothetical protein